MPRMKLKDEDIHISMTADQKAQLQTLAKLHGKSLSQYLVDAGMSMTLDRSKINFYENIQDDLKYLKQSLYVLTKLTLLVANDQYKNQELVMKFTKAATEEAENYFKE